uniref:Putative site-specific tyrosine recombinase n=1 Tax=viral metagenome TaxID=1070528 RepID=A0A6M3JNV3_9ZZZZ
MPKRGDSAEYALNSEQADKLLRTCTDLRERIIIGSMVYMGMRISELLHMQSHWLTDDDCVRIPSRQECTCSSCLKRKGGIWTPKTKAGAREIPIPKSLIKDFDSFYRQHPNGLSLSRGMVWLHVKAILKRAGVRSKWLAKGTIFPHALRATSATLLAAGGIDSAALCYYMGWTDLKVGEHYIKLAQARDSALRQARQIFK